MFAIQLTELALRHELVVKAVEVYRIHIKSEGNTVLMPSSTLIHLMKKLQPDSNAKYAANVALKEGLYTRTKDHQSKFRDATIFRECSICFNLLKNKDVAICENQCSLVSCQECIDRSLEQSKTCPGCRSEMPISKDGEAGRKALKEIDAKKEMIQKIILERAKQLQSLNPLFREL
jgi:hypothetical protein